MKKRFKIEVKPDDIHEGYYRTVYLKDTKYNREYFYRFYPRSVMNGRGRVRKYTKKELIEKFRKDILIPLLKA